MYSIHHLIPNTRTHLVLEYPTYILLLFVPATVEKGKR